MKNSKIFSAIASIALLLSLSACKDSKSYAELLTDENHAVNIFLADHRVVGHPPVDSVFEVGPDAPYYMMDDEGNIYMQVLDAGDLNLRPSKDDIVYFRFTRYNLKYYEPGEEMTGAGNADDISGSNGLGAQSFQFDNFSSSTTVAYGNGMQLPMHWLGNNAKVNLILKSQFGWTSEIGNVIPYLYTIRYYQSPLTPW